MPASALDRHAFITTRHVAIALDGPVARGCLAKRYPASVIDAALAAAGRYVVLPPAGALEDLASVDAVARIAERLRAPGGCPWDREQTHASLRTALLEEAYEVVAAIGSGDLVALRDELGDLLFHVVIHAQLAHEEGAFDLGDVARAAGEKLVRRHPHVFAGVPLQGDVLAQWERIKREERQAGVGSGDERASIVGGLPPELPALFAAERLLERAARVGVVPPRTDLPIDVDDEGMLGELLFDLAALAREMGFDAETSLRQANAGFSARIRSLEERARADGRALESYSADEMRALWAETA
ncbi:nucleoside triphosphate pyrophosphohydrolase [soil metagenome]